MQISKNIKVTLNQTEIEDLVRKAVLEALPGVNIESLDLNILCSPQRIEAVIEASEGAQDAKPAKTKAAKVAAKNGNIAANLEPAPKEEKTPSAEATTEESDPEPEPESPRQAEVPNLEQVDIPEFEPDEDDDIPFEVDSSPAEDDDASGTTAKPDPKKSLSLMEQVNAEVDEEEAREAAAAKAEDGEKPAKKKKLGDLFS